MSKRLVKKHGHLPRRKEDDPFHAIWRHYHDKNYDIVLSDNQKIRLEIYEKAFDIYTKGFSRGETVKALKVAFEEKGIFFSIRTGFKYLEDACDIFGINSAFSWDLERSVLYETGKSMLQKYIDKEPKAAATVYQSLIKLAQLDKGDNELAEIIKGLKANTIIITADAEALKKEADELMQDVGYEDVSEEEEDGDE